MTRNVYALFVGIDDYPNVSKLKGCVNDVSKIKLFLEQRLTAQGDTFHPKLLTDQAATRENVIHSFRQHLGQAGPNDVAFFYYAGHGAQAPTPPELGHLEPDGLDETLVCYDSRLPGKFDLADKELSLLISEVAANGTHVTIILDCCHSGGGTRFIPSPEVDVRLTKVDKRERTWQDYLLFEGQSEAPDPATVTIPSGKHVLFAACRDDELAKETNFDGERRGVFSYYLLDTLKNANSSVTYQDIFKRIDTLVRTKVSMQAPSLEAINDATLVDQPFLGGAIQPTPPYATLRHDKNDGWQIDQGEMHGILKPSGTETTVLALFSIETDLGNLTTLNSALGHATVTRVTPTTSNVSLTGDPTLKTTEVYKALVISQPLQPLGVTFEGDAGALDHVRQVLAEIGPDNTASMLVEEVERSSDFTLTATDNRYQLKRSGDAYKLNVDVPGFTADSALLVANRLEHMARWQKFVELQNTSSALPADAVRMELFPINANGEAKSAEAGKTMRIAYNFDGEKWQRPGFKLKLTNTTDRELYVMLFYQSETYGIFPLLEGNGGGEILGPGAELWINKNRPLWLSIKDELWQAGVTEFKDILKLIVSTEPGDARSIKQSDLPVTGTRDVTMAEHFGPMTTLSRLMRRVNTRHISMEPEPDESFVDWTTSEATVITVRPLEAVPLNTNGKTTLLSGDVKVSAHAGLNANIRFETIEQTTRSLDIGLVPPVLQNLEGEVEPLEFSATRSGMPGLSVMVLDDITGQASVTPDSPLKIQLPNTLAENEVILPVARDDEFFYPLGVGRQNGDQLEIEIHTLPDPLSQGVRDLKSTVKILFHKLVLQQLGKEYTYPHLAIADAADDGTVAYNPNLEDVAARVKTAKSVLVYVHGIIGDTKLMAASSNLSAQKWGEIEALANSTDRMHGITREEIVATADKYDLVLTYDYESFNTTIQDNARLLKQRLEYVGLGAGHSKTVHFVVHSMGSLISRWFIEREGGNKIVDRLVMCGPPNGGSPWPKVQDWATVALTAALNGMATTAWPIAALGWLIKGVDKLAISLDQMNAQSDFYKDLNSSPDPKVPYIVIAGNTSIIKSALLPDSNSGDSKLARLIAKLKQKQLVNKASSIAFFLDPNDVAVGVKSAFTVPTEREPKPEFVEIASDHFSFFLLPQSLKIIGELALKKE